VNGINVIVAKVRAENPLRSATSEPSLFSALVNCIQILIIIIIITISLFFFLQGQFCVSDFRFKKDVSLKKVQVD
jgi:hypothetical protein